MKNIVALLLILMATAKSFSQNGFAGKVHQVNFDFVGLYQKQFKMDYKWSVGKHFALGAELGLNSLSRNFTDDYDASMKGVDKYKGKLYGVGILWNSMYAGMSMPMGYYLGLFLVRTKGNLDEQWDLKTNSYVAKSTTLKSVYGRNFYLGHNFTLDISFALGVRFGKVTGKEGVDRLPYSNYPYAVIFSKRIDPDRGISSGYGTVVGRSVNLYFMPEVKLGYIF